jgi:AcrR family transcriptional regulator
MGRRSVHTAEELRELILRASTELIEHHGLGGLSAREIARRIDYSPGTLYNVFENLDDLVLTIEGRLLDRLADTLAAITAGTPDPRQRLLRLAEAYLAFTHQNPRLWNLLFEHHLPAGRTVPTWYVQKLEGLLAHVEDALAPIMQDRDPQSLKRAARVLWAGVHGITSLSTADKLSIISSETAGPLIADLVETYLAGIGRQAKPVRGP